MAGELVWVQYAHHSGEYVPGDQVELDMDEARQLVADGIVNYATVPDAKKAGADPEEAATKKK